MKKRKFPPPVQITDHLIGWKETEIRAWIDARQPKHAPAA
jgi:predicted DNA-binding transcriptional regulator AlpA